MPPNELVGLTEIAEMLGRSRKTAYNYSQRADFPKPFDRLARGRVWRRREVQRWAEKYLPIRTGRPRKRP